MGFCGEVCAGASAHGPVCDGLCDSGADFVILMDFEYGCCPLAPEGLLEGLAVMAHVWDPWWIKLQRLGVQSLGLGQSCGERCKSGSCCKVKPDEVVVLSPEVLLNFLVGRVWAKLPGCAMVAPVPVPRSLQVPGWQGWLPRWLTGAGGHKQSQVLTSHMLSFNLNDFIPFLS